MSDAIACKIIGLITGLTKAEHRAKSEHASLYALVLTLLPYTVPQLNSFERLLRLLSYSVVFVMWNLIQQGKR